MSFCKSITKYVLLACGSCIFTTATWAQDVPSMAEFQITLAKHQTLPLANTISIEYSSSLPQRVIKQLQQWPEIKAKQLNDNTVLIELPQQAKYITQDTHEQLSQQYLQDSFVIDTSESSTLAFTQNFERLESPQLDLQNLSAYVNQYINKPSYIHGFNIASVVADQRSGDCTEYAVLLTALARSLGLPARVIIGTVIVEETNKASAFGHAWVEVLQNEEWHILDAALYQSQARKHFYLPASDLSNEGPGFGLSLINAAVLLPARLQALKSVE